MKIRLIMGTTFGPVIVLITGVHRCFPDPGLAVSLDVGIPLS